MTIVRIGATQEYAEGWELAFGRGKKKKSAQEKPAKRAAKRSAKATGKTSNAKRRKKK